MPKYTKEFKIKLVLDYLSGKSCGLERIVKKCDIPNGIFINWIDKDKEVKDEIKTIIEKSKGRYGYRRVTILLKNKGFNINHKRVLRIMREESLLFSKFKTRSRKYSSYKSQIGKVATNVVNRQFEASKPNRLWLTDVTEFRIKSKEKKNYTYHQY